MSLCSEWEGAEKRRRGRPIGAAGFGCKTFGTRDEQAARIREAGKKARIHALTDRIVNGVWNKTLTPVETEGLLVELAKLTGNAEFV